MSQDQQWNALKRIIRRLPAQSVYYASALGAIVLAGGGQLPPGLEFVAGGIGANVLSNLIEEIAKGEDVLDDDIRKRAEDAIQRSNIANLLTKQDFLQGYARLIQRLDAQKEISEDILIELHSGFDKVATADQVAELKALILDFMDNSPQQSVQKSRVFISYARADDEPFVEKLYNDLKDEFDVWWDRVSMPNRGLTFLQEIREAIDWSDRLVLVAGPKAFQSDYVRDEWQYAYNTYKGINIVLRIGDYQDLPEKLGVFDAPDFREDGEYEERLRTLKRQLEEPVAPIGNFYNVPSLPPHFLNRHEALDTLRDLVIADVDKPAPINAEKRTTVVEGMGGVGKSVMATALAYDRKVRFAFPDGIIWITVGRETNLYEVYRAVGITMGDKSTNYPEQTIALQNVRKLLADKRCLLILDDLWELTIGEAFHNLVSGMPTRLLITTRNLQVSTILNVKKFYLDLISKPKAIEYLQSWIGQDKSLGLVAKHSGYLFLALKLAGARIKLDNLTGADYVRLFKYTSNVGITGEETPSFNLAKNIKIGLERVFSNVQADQRLFNVLGIFPENETIPVNVVMRLWNQIMPEISEFDLLETLNLLISLCLLERVSTDNSVKLHTLLHSYALEQLGSSVSQFHNELLSSYNPHGESWNDLVDNKYLLNHLTYHLRSAGRTQDLHKLLTGSKDWMLHLASTEQGIHNYILDLQLEINQYDTDELNADELVRLVELTTAYRISYQISAYYDEEMLTLLCKIGRFTEAINHARYNRSAIQRYKGLMTIWNDLVSRSIHEPLETILVNLEKTILDLRDNESIRATRREYVVCLCYLGKFESASHILNLIEVIGKHSTKSGIELLARRMSASKVGYSDIDTEIWLTDVVKAAREGSAKWAQNTDLALKIVYESLSKVDDFVTQTKSLTKLLVDLHKHGCSGMCVNVLEDICNRIRSVSDRIALKRLGNVVVHQCIESKLFKYAFEIILLLETRDQIELLKHLGTQLKSDNEILYEKNLHQLHSAIKQVESQGKYSEEQPNFHSIIVNLHFADVSDIISNLQELAHLDEQIEVLYQLGHAYSKVGGENDEIVKQAQLLLSQIEKDHVNEEKIQKLLKILSWQNKSDEIIDVLNNLDNPELKLSLVQSIVSDLSVTTAKDIFRYAKSTILSIYD